MLNERQGLGGNILVLSRRTGRAATVYSESPKNTPLEVLSFLFHRNGVLVESSNDAVLTSVINGARGIYCDYPLKPPLPSCSRKGLQSPTQRMVLMTMGARTAMSVCPAARE